MNSSFKKWVKRDCTIKNTPESGNKCKINNNTVTFRIQGVSDGPNATVHHVYTAKITQLQNGNKSENCLNRSHAIDEMNKSMLDSIFNIHARRATTNPQIKRKRKNFIYVPYKYNFLSTYRRDRRCQRQHVHASRLAFAIA